MAQEEFLLKWNDHHVSFFNIVEELCRSEQLCDVTLACGGQVFETHKLILSVCSPFFRALLGRNSDKHPIVYLKDVNPKHLELLLSYMYRGEINVLQNDLGPLIQTAKGLQIKGLADAGNEEDNDSSPMENGELPRVPQPAPSHPVKRPTPPPVLLTQRSIPQVPQRPHLQQPAPKRIRVVTPPQHNLNVPKISKVLSVPHLTTPGQGLTPVLPLPPVVLAPSPGPGGLAPGIVQKDGGKVEGCPKLVKMEQNNEDSNDWTGMEQYPSENSQEKTSFEQELQLEDEQYIQPEGLSQQQITMLQREIQKKYPCEFCHKRFPTPSKLQRHKLVHSGEKPYCCHLCKKGFTQKVHLNTHMRQSHGAPPEWGSLMGHQIAGDGGGGFTTLEDGEVLPLDLKPNIIDVNDDLSGDGSVTVVNNTDGSVGIIGNNIDQRSVVDSNKIDESVNMADDDDEMNNSGGGGAESDSENQLFISIDHEIVTE